MRDPKRISRILEKLGKAWTYYPDLRLRQLCDAIVNECDPRAHEHTFYMEDDQFESALDAWLRKQEGHFVLLPESPNEPIRGRRVNSLIIDEALEIPNHD